LASVATASGIPDAISLTTLALEGWSPGPEADDFAQRMREHVDGLTVIEVRMAATAGAILFASALRAIDPEGSPETLRMLALKIAKGLADL